MNGYPGGLLLYNTGAFAAGIWLAGFGPRFLPWMYVLAALLLLSTLFLALRRRKKILWFLGLSFFLTGMISSLQAGRLSAEDISGYAGQNVILYGQIDEAPQVSQREQRTGCTRTASSRSS